jgi:hypothetical protein
MKDYQLIVDYKSLNLVEELNNYLEKTVKNLLIDTNIYLMLHVTLSLIDLKNNQEFIISISIHKKSYKGKLYIYINKLNI